MPRSNNLPVPEDKDLIIRALPFDDQLAEIVLEKGIPGRRAQEALTLARLSHERDSLPIAWIKAVASLRDPATYPELKAYFIRCSNRKSTFGGTPDASWNWGTRRYSGRGVEKGEI